MSMTASQQQAHAVDVIVRYQRHVEKLEAELRHYKQLVANAQLRPQKYEFDLAPGDPGFHFTREAMPGDPGWQGGAQ